MKTITCIPSIKKDYIMGEIKRLIWLITIPLGFLLPSIAASFYHVIENIYYKGFYTKIYAILSTITGILPFSLAEIILYVSITVLPANLVYRLICAISPKKQWFKLYRTIVIYLTVFGVCLNAYYIMWGFNYFRPPLSSLLSINIKERPIEELEALCYSLRDNANQLRSALSEDENGVFTIDKNECLNAIPMQYKALADDYPAFSTPATKPKPVIYSKGMSLLGISGIYIGFTAEPNVNMDQPSLLFAASAAHEASHGIGYARENEANFISFLACFQSENMAIKYSGVMLALINASNQLYNGDRESYIQLYSTFSDKIKRDLAHHSSYWKSFEGPAEEAMTTMNDNYLKHNHQEKGVKSYGEIVDLLLGWQEKYPEYFTLKNQP